MEFKKKKKLKLKYMCKQIEHIKFNNVKENKREKERKKEKRERERERKN